MSTLLASPSLPPFNLSAIPGALLVHADNTVYYAQVADNGQNNVPMVGIFTELFSTTDQTTGESVPDCLFASILCVSVCMSVYLHVCLLVCTSVYLHVCLLACTSVTCMFICLSVCLFTYMSICLSVCLLLACLSACLYVCLLVSMSVTCTFVCLSSPNCLLY